MIETALLGSPTTVALRPRFEGSNICTWIGFKHVNYLVEEAVLEHFRRHGLAARVLYERHGLGLDIVDIDTRILHALHMDDEVRAEVAQTTRPDDRELAFTVAIHVERDGESLKAVTSKVRAVLRADTWNGAAAEPAPSELARFTVPRIRRGEQWPPDNAANSFTWKWRIPYFYCHFVERIQMSGYLRLMEEVVDLFLADRGVSIKTLLDQQRLIPVVPRSSISMLDEALMEEELHTVFTVEDVFKDFTYTARMDCYVPRGDRVVHTATGRITHGYAVIENRRDWSLVSLDGRMLDALNRSGGACAAF
jgi:acyl-CoA thioesterase FadM